MALAAASCAQGTPPPSNVNATTTPAQVEPSSGALINEAYRYFLDPPGEPWRLIEQRDIQRIARNAQVGAMRSTPTGLGYVTVEAAPDVGLQQIARIALEAMTLQNRQVLVEERGVIEGRDTIRTVVAGQIEGQPVRYVREVFLHQGYAYSLVAWNGQLDDDPEGRLLQPFFDAFHLMPGPIAARIELPEIGEAREEDWRLRGRRFESAASGLEVERSDQWRFIVGDQLTKMNANAELGLISTQAEVRAVLIPERIPEANQRSYQRVVLQNLEAATGERFRPTSLTVALDGATLPLFGAVTEGQELLVGTRCHSSSCTQLLFWYSRVQRDRAPEVLSGFPRVRFVDEDERAALEVELRAEPVHRSQVGPGYALRQGHLIDFDRRLELRLPSPLWRATIGQAAAALDAEALAVLEHRRLGVTVNLYTTNAAPGEDALQAAHEQSLATVEGERLDATPRALTVGGGQALESLVRVVGVAGALLARIITVQRGPQILTFWVHGYEELLRAADDELTALLARVELAEGPLSPTQHDVDRYVDRRLGFALALPEQGWSVTDSTPEVSRPTSAGVTAQREGATCRLLVMHPPNRDVDREHLIGMIEAQFQRTMGRPPEEAGQGVDATLAGQPCRLTRWLAEEEATEICLIARGSTIVMFIATARASEQPLQALRDRFSFID